jgi:hypothetical protein
MHRFPIRLRTLLPRFSPDRRLAKQLGFQFFFA